MYGGCVFREDYKMRKIIFIVLVLLCCLAVLAGCGKKTEKEPPTEKPIEEPVKEPAKEPTTEPTPPNEPTAPGNDSEEKTSQGYTVVTHDGLTTIDGVVIANKTYALPAGYDPNGLTAECQEAFSHMKDGAAASGFTIWNQSGFRSYGLQEVIYNDYCASDGQAAADRYSARPGHSEHQSGLAIDLNTISDDFGETPEGRWVAAHCAEYGFILRYPKEKEAQTGYLYEPWHIRYVGDHYARAITDSGLCLEEYFGITSVY
jgi:D-alanyl-D-alanine carboxypeptidase